MRWRMLALFSLGANLLLAVALLLSARQWYSNRSLTTAGLTTTSGSSGRTNIIFRRQFFSWREVESEDYPTYVANLRDIGCPEQTIRDIIIADVNALYGQKRATNIITAEQQWWRPEP